MSATTLSPNNKAASDNFSIGKVERSFGSVCGHTFRQVRHGIETGADHFFRCTAAIKDDLTTVAFVLRGVGNTLSNIKTSEGGQRFGGKLTTRFTDAITFIDGIQIISDCNYFINREYQKKSEKPFCIAAHLLFFAGDLGTCAEWVESLGFKLSRFVESVGQVRVFNTQPLKMLPKFPLGAALSGCFFGGYVLLAGDAIHRLVDPRLSRESYKTEKQIKATLDLAQYVAAVAGIVFGWAGVTSTPLIIGIGLIGLGIGTASFLYGVYQGKKLDPDLDLDQDVYR